MEIDRRRFFQLSGLSLLQLAALGARKEAVASPRVSRQVGFGPLVRRRGGLLDLPRGFECVSLQRAGTDRLDDGRPVPGCLDGMACFDAGNGRWTLVRNHEIGNAAWVDEYKYTGQSKIVKWSAADGPIDPTMHGGVSRVTLDAASLRRKLGGDRKAQPVVGTHMALVGTDCNCSGGRVADGWVSCEETDTDGHGYAFWVSPSPGLAPRRLDAWGRFKREAVAVAEGAVYMTEDIANGAFYRFRPASAGEFFGPGVLEVLVLPGFPDTHRPGERVLPDGFVADVRWEIVPDPGAAKVPCRDQVPSVTRFCRNEGVAWDGTDLWFVSTMGGRLEKGQIFKLTPGRGAGPDRLRLMFEVENPRVLSLPDNLVFSPWGDLILCEDNYSSEAAVRSQHIRGMTPDGRLYDLARNPQNTPIAPGLAPGDEFTGLCFSPDGQVLFVNLQGDRDETLAITGPWGGR